MQYIIPGDCLATLRGMPDECIDSVVTDPPYGLSKEPDMIEVLGHWLAGDEYEHKGAGFMGKTWDSFVPGPEVWREVLRVLKPGGHALVFSGTRTYDLTVLAMRIAGFEIRDQLAWMYGQGFPKSYDISKGIDKEAGAVRDVIGVCRTNKGDSGTKTYAALGAFRQTTHTNITEPATPGAEKWQGWGTALKPAYEPICLARKPFSEKTIAKNVLRHGTGGLNIDRCRIGTEDTRAVTGGRQSGGWGTKPGAVAGSALGRHPANVLMDEAAGALLDEKSGQRKTVTAVRSGGVSGGATSISRPKPVGTPDVPARENGGGASRFFYAAKVSKGERERGLTCVTVGGGSFDPYAEPKRMAQLQKGRKAAGLPPLALGDPEWQPIPGLSLQTAGELTGGREEGSAGLDNPRAGAGRTSNGRANGHPTVKPVSAMRYLVRLITPPNGVVLDPYTGSGTTGIAAKLEGLCFVGCELDDEYCTIARARIEAWSNDE